MKILIISGFLGAGKTTFIKELIRRTEKNFVILENEYGSTDIDEQILTSEDEADVWDLTEGCICCTKSADLNASVMTIESTLEPEYLIVEPSGVGALSNVIRNLQKIEYERIRLLKPVTILDAVHFTHDRAAFGDVYQDQLQTAGYIAISKPEHPDSGLTAEIETAIRECNPDAEILPQHYTNMPQEWWDRLLTTAYDGAELREIDESDLNLETFTIREGRVASPVSLLWILQNAVSGKFGEIIRAKGYLPAGQEWVRFDIVNGTIAITGYENESVPDTAETVWIGRAIDRIGLLLYLKEPGREPRINDPASASENQPKKITPPRRESR